MQSMIANWLPDITQWRRDIHQHPELGFNEFRTSDLVAKKLEAFGYQVHRGLGKTGVVGTLKVGTPHLVVLACAPIWMHCLYKKPMMLITVPVHPKVMHACGHDGHTAMLLGAARYLAETKSFNGTVQLIFQPAEEGLGRCTHHD